MNHNTALKIAVEGLKCMWCDHPNREDRDKTEEAERIIREMIVPEENTLKRSEALDIALVSMSYYRLYGDQEHYDHVCKAMKMVRRVFENHEDEETE